jgi:hypothetical protein
MWMDGQLRKSQQRTFWNTDSAIGFVESADGLRQCDSPDFRVLSEFGRRAFHVSHSLSLDDDKALQTSDICGQSSETSWKSADLQASLENKLRASLDVNGSLEYELTWKKWDMSVGPPIFALRASARRISGKGSTGVLFGWPTPNTMPDAPNMSTNRGDGDRQRLTPQSVPGLVGWPTPRTMTGGAESAERKQELGRVNSGGSDLQAVAMMSGWGTPRVTTNGGLSSPDRAGNRESRLEDQVQGWTTPSARDWKDTPGMSTTATNPDGSVRERLDHLPRQIHGATGISSNAEMGKRGVLAPEFARWLMGFPEIWDAASPGYDSFCAVQDAIESEG